MSGFLTGRGARLTGKKLAIVIAASMLACAAFGLIAPLVGVATAPDGGRSLELLGYDSQLVAVRLPRVLASLLVGGALAGAGCALQGWLRNPLADPFTLGISSGSSLAAVLAIRLGLESLLGDLGKSVAAVAGAVATLLAVASIARIGKQLPPVMVVLAGVTVAMFCSAATLLIQETSDFTDIEHMITWMVGSLDAVRLVQVKYAAGPICAALIALVAYGRELNALAAGPEVAASLGVAVGRTQVSVFALASLLVGAAIFLCGPIGFVGLIVPHALRALIGPDHRALLPASIFGGAIVLVVCDTLARTVVPTHLSTGAVTAALGVPFFLVILVRQKTRASLWGA
jgi:iron complex transport system permease protein